MNFLSTEKRSQVVSALVEGVSINAICPMTGISKGAVLNLLADIGEACAEYHDKNVRRVRTRRLQCDEIWQFIGAKRKNVTPEQERPLRARMAVEERHQADLLRQMQESLLGPTKEAGS